MDELIVRGFRDFFRNNIPFIRLWLRFFNAAVLSGAISLCYEHVYTDFISGGV
jgi:hypothetical protein